MIIVGSTYRLIVPGYSELCTGDDALHRVIGVAVNTDTGEEIPFLENIATNRMYSSHPYIIKQDFKHFHLVEDQC